MSSELDEFENIDELENVGEVMDEASDDTEDIGETSDDSATEAAVRPATGRGSRSEWMEKLKCLTIYDAMLIASALSVSLACLLLFLELTSFGGLFFQWRTNEAFVEPLTLP